MVSQSVETGRTKPESSELLGLLSMTEKHGSLPELRRTDFVVL